MAVLRCQLYILWPPARGDCGPGSCAAELAESSCPFRISRGKPRGEAPLCTNPTDLCRHESRELNPSQVFFPPAGMHKSTASGPSYCSPHIPAHALRTPAWAQAEQRVSEQASWRSPQCRREMRNQKAVNLPSRLSWRLHFLCRLLGSPWHGRALSGFHRKEVESLPPPPLPSPPLSAAKAAGAPASASATEML